MPKLSQKEQKIIKKADKLLTDLSKEFNVPKPHYCIHKLDTLKKLDKWEYLPQRGVMTLEVKTVKPAFMFDACFVPDFLGGIDTGKHCYITLLSKNNRSVSKKFIVHEFFHYKHYVENNYDCSNRTQEEKIAEEKLTQSETQRYMKKLKDKVK